MANNLSVVVLTPNGRRNTVKCNPNTTILQILEQTCTKHGFQPNDYDLTHHNHVLDVSTTLRFSGLPNNAFLEMAETKKTRTESEVILGLQLENGERIMGNFTPSTDLLSILTSLVPTQCAPELNPVIIYMRREVYGADSLKETTLKSLGLTGGRAVLRLIHRTPEQLKVQANVSAAKVYKPKNETSEISFNTSSVLSSTKISNEQTENVDKQNNEVPDNDSSGSFSSCSGSVLNNTLKSIPDSVAKSSSLEDESMDTAESCNTETGTNVTMETELPTAASDNIEELQDDSHLEEEIIVLGERNALVFSQNMSSRLPYDDLPDDFYDLSVNEVRKLFTDLGKRREELENTPLQTEALKNLEVNRRVISQLHDYRKVVLRILFPNRTVLQGTFGPLDTLQTVHNFVSDYLQSPSEPFDLYVTPPKQILKLDATLVDSNCVPSALIYFGPGGEASEGGEVSSRQYLKEEIMSKLSSPEAASFSASKTRGIKSVNESRSTESAPTSTGSNPDTFRKPGRSQPFSVPGPSRAKDSKVPKWFKSGV